MSSLDLTRHCMYSHKNEVSEASGLCSGATRAAEIAECLYLSPGAKLNTGMTLDDSE